MFIYALLYGTDIYPNTRKFFRDVHITMALILSLKPENDLKLRLDKLSNDCKRHVEQGVTLEAQHLFASMQITILAEAITDGAVTLSRDLKRQVQYGEGSTLARLFRRHPVAVKGGQNEELQGAIDAIRGLQACCSKLREVVSYINGIIGRVQLPIGEVARLLERTKDYGDERSLAEEHLKWAQEIVRVLCRVLESYLDNTLHYRVTLALLQKDRTDYLNTHMAIQWRNDMKAYITQVKR